MWRGIFTWTLIFLPIPSVATSSTQTGSLLPLQCMHESLRLRGWLTCAPEGRTYVTTTSGQTIGSRGEPGLEVAKSGPWTYNPVCTHFLPSIGSELCVYTDVGFYHGRGISIITTPGAAEEIVKLPPFQDPTVLDHIIQAGNLRSAGNLKGKGKGFLAGRDHRRGELLTSNLPLLIAPILENELSWEEHEEFLRVAVSRLPMASQRLLRPLTAFSGGTDLLLLGVFNSNGGFSAFLGGVHHYALFPELSLLNHHCAPNTQVHLDNSLLTLTVRAARSISQGEELGFSYLGREGNTYLQSFAQRQLTIGRINEFKCACSRCQKGNSTDAILKEIHELHQALDNWNQDAVATSTDAIRLIRLYKQEGLDAFIDNAYGLAALAYSGAGDAEGARKYAMLTIETLSREKNPSFPSSKWQQLVDWPEAHWSWKWRIQNYDRVAKIFKAARV
ncbi:hypothetical protein GQ44DRAFT_716270 [Phaeosphaeriaceae sp. PMI808]|nr:hypothetical protein GQ44DRAFT_716270 [Phaeosphaeriaceae sp. PMI808]